MEHPDVTCDRFREDLPLLVATGDVFPDVMVRHRRGCEPCRKEEAVVRALFAMRPEPPAELARTISAALRAGSSLPEERGASDPRPARGSGVMRLLLPVAALLVAVLGTVLVWQGRGSPTSGEGGPTVAAVDGGPAGLDGMHLWPSANGMVAGEPLMLLDGLTEAQLEALLREMDG